MFISEEIEYMCKLQQYPYMTWLIISDCNRLMKNKVIQIMYY